METHEAGGEFAPGQYAFCNKICSKLIISQFCVVLLNSDIVDGVEKPNANVNMEYGLMLGFNKYVIPFQLEGLNLPFNVSGLDTVKYTSSNFNEKAEKAIDQALVDVKQDNLGMVDLSQGIHAYLLLKGAVFCDINNPDNKVLFDMGNVCGFNLCMEFDAIRYMYFGNFANLRADVVINRVKKLFEVWDSRTRGMFYKEQKGIITAQQKDMFFLMYSIFKVVVLVNSEDTKNIILNCPEFASLKERLDVVSVVEMNDAIERSDLF